MPEKLIMKSYPDDFACEYKDTGPTGDRCPLMCARKKIHNNPAWFSGWITIHGFPKTYCPFIVRK